jgi:hypothetical protein
MKNYPLVTLYCSPDSNALWSGKWHLNIATNAVEAMGGPWKTEQDAVTAVLATGQWQQRKDCQTPHFDRVEAKASDYPRQCSGAFECLMND